MKIRLCLSIMLAAAMTWAMPASAAGLERLYVFYCGTQVGKDQALWTPGVNAGQPVTFSNTCYLIRHQRGTMIWDTGLSDALAAMPNGIVGAGGNIHMTKTKTLAAQLAELNIRPGDINLVGVSHHHGDHVGNLALFTGATVLIQEAEYDAGQAAMAKPEYAPTQKINKLKGDHDVFGDGSVMILSTPGHTPGHQVLLVNLPKTGSVLLTGDAVHLQVSWDNKMSPGFNFNKDQTVASIEKMAKVLAEKKGQLWIGHDKTHFDRMKLSPAFYD